MKRVYVAGPYSSDNVLVVLKNIGNAIETAEELFTLGYAPYCPHLDYHYALRGGHSVADFYKMSLAWLEVSDAVFFLTGWGDSKGCNMEYERALELGILTFSDMKRLLEVVPP